MKKSKSLIWMLSGLLIVIVLILDTQLVLASENTFDVSGSVYEFEDGSNYDISSVSDDVLPTAGNAIGILQLAGNAKETGLVGGVQTYTVPAGNISFSYVFDPAFLNKDETEWHLIDDGSKKVDDITLKKNIQSGAVIVQSSRDGKTWLTDKQIVDAFSNTDSLTGSIYTTQDIQLENGCYYKIFVVYREERKTGEKKIAFVTKDIKEQKEVAEVYEFYAINGNSAETTNNADTTPRKIIASKPINTGKDNGYSGNVPIQNEDPHFGWNLGKFIINGYTRETYYNGTPVYLKNVGDKVTLWFTLDEDINCLHKNVALSINEDTNGYDLLFGVAKTNFGHGTLIISYTDFEGITHDPIIYTDFLAANARTGADTRVQLFEEGDYDVTLDYEIKNSPRKIGNVAVIPTYTNYKIAFGFSIRNGNCMVYPFDAVTGNELSDNSITPNGFSLDMAKSRYLNIDVTRSVLNSDSDGLVTEDVRFSRPAKDSDCYIEDGIYNFTVKNLYTGMINTKTIYVGKDKYLRALSKNNITVDELNRKIKEGYIVEANGNLSLPPEPESSSAAVSIAVPETETSKETIEDKEINAAKDLSENKGKTEPDTSTVFAKEPVTEFEKEEETTVAGTTVASSEAETEEATDVATTEQTSEAKKETSTEIATTYETSGNEKESEQLKPEQTQKTKETESELETSEEATLTNSNHNPENVELATAETDINSEANEELSKTDSGNSKTTAILVILGLVVAGGGVYFWQKKQKGDKAK